MEPDLEVSARDFALVIGVSGVTVAALAKDGVIERSARGKFMKDASVRAYCEHLRMVAAGRGGREAIESLSDERARLAKEQADGHALKNAQMRGELVPVADVDMTWGTMVRDLRAGVLAIASRIASRLNHLSKDDVLVIDDEIRDALKILGNDGVKDAPQGP